MYFDKSNNTARKTKRHMVGHSLTVLGLGSQAKPCFRLVAIMFIVAFLSIFYFFSDVTTAGYIELIKRVGSDSDLNFNGPPTYMISYNGLAQNISEEPRDGYLVWNPSCRIPDIDPYHESIKSFLKTQAPYDCSQYPPLTVLKENVLSVVPEAVKHYSSTKTLKCCYHVIYRNDSDHLPFDKKPDDLYKLTRCKAFDKTRKLDDNEQFILVKCSSNKTSTKHKEVYKNMHARVSLTPAVLEKLKANEERLSVLMVGIDSISRMNLIRTMPKTVKYLDEGGWLDLKGYNKMDDNTFPNLMAILTGQSPKQIRNAKGCFPSNRHNIDNCPFIWKEFSKAGYVTAYGEDEPSIGTFNYQKSGFYDAPTDYYFRPFMLAAEKFMKLTKKDGLDICLGPTLTSDHILKYTSDLATTFRNNLYFALFWMNSFSHNNVNSPSSMDLRMLRFFKDLTESGALNNTLVVFLSDHGMRFGKIRETLIGWLEERLPFIYFKIPEWYERKYPERLSNFNVNRNRLTSPYDLHMTLKEVLNVYPNGTAACPKCLSLFDEIPWNRSCLDVGVTEHWCTCSEYKIISTEGQSVKTMVNFVLNELNKILLSGRNFTTKNKRCAELRMNKVLAVRSKLFQRSLGYDEYIVLFETQPGRALFEATIRHGHDYQLLDTVSRLNGFGKQSICMPDAYLMKYCYCVDS
uniref:Uncharacterized protein n=1 Tax=Clastoptera arizonana TaxID=38151 RepID=A0A1B6C907_9HEMI